MNIYKLTLTASELADLCACVGQVEAMVRRGDPSLAERLATLKQALDRVQPFGGDPR